MRRWTYGFGLLALACSSSAPPITPEPTVAVVEPAKPPTPTLIPTKPKPKPKPPPDLGNLAGNVRFVRQANLFAEPSVTAERIGVIRGNARAVVRDVAPAGDGCKRRWIEIAPRGWTCEDAVERTTEPLPAPPVISLAPDEGKGPLVPGLYGVVKSGTLAYASEEDVRAGNGRVLSGNNTVRAGGAMTIDGVRYWHTTRGELVDASAINVYGPSKFEGIAIEPDQPMPAWVRHRSDPSKPVDTFDAAGVRIGTLAPRTRVTALEETPDLVRVSATEWVARKDLRITSLAAPPAGIADDEKWFDVVLDEQVLVAYEGKRPVYATLVSSGKPGHFTPARMARVMSKQLTAPMTGDDVGEEYSVADVPWTMFYDGNYALHTSYWHDQFGGPKSHGCINLSPRDAKKLYHWSSPDVPPGWIAVYGNADIPGSLVRVRSSRTPDPPLHGYATRMP